MMAPQQTNLASCHELPLGICNIRVPEPRRQLAEGQLVMAKLTFCGARRLTGRQARDWVHIYPDKRFRGALARHLKSQHAQLLTH